MPEAVRTQRIQRLEQRRDAIAAQLLEFDNQVVERGADLDEGDQATYSSLETELAETAQELTRQYEREQLLASSIELGNSVGRRPAPGSSGAPEDEPIYRAEATDAEHDPLMDVWRAQVMNDPEAQTRIREHNDVRVRQGVRILRASDRSDFGGLIVPEYAVSEFAELAREQRTFLNSLPSRPLTRSPVVIPLQTVGAAMGTPATENTAYTTADPASTPLTLTARTISGVAEVSVEAVEFGTLESPILFGDMFNAYAERFDYQAFHGTGLNNTHLGVFATPDIQTISGAGITGTTSAELFRKTYNAVLRAAAQIRSIDKRTASHVAMSSMRWYSLNAATDADGRPLMADSSTFPSNVGGSVPGRIFAGLQVVVDDNIIESGQPDDKILVYRAQEYVLREQNGGNPATIRVDQAKAAQGTVQFIARGFSIFSAGRRPKSTCVIEDVPEPTFEGDDES